MGKPFNYHFDLKWTGFTGNENYLRSGLVRLENKTLEVSADAAFRGDKTKWNPEELLLISIASCHMLSYLHLCSVNKILVKSYSDSPKAIMMLEANGVGKFVEATLSPVVEVDPSHVEKAKELHHEAHQKCFIANSVNFPINVNII